MTAPFDQNIALVIETQARLDGVRQAQDGMSAIGKTAEESSAVTTSAIAQSANAEAALAAQINASIGAFIKLGQSVDAKNQQAVAAYRQEGDALAAYLAGLDAEERQINKIGAAIAALEMKSGAARLQLLPPVNPEDEQAIQRVPRQARTAADALVVLSSAAITGGGSMQSMAIASGGLVTGIARLSSNAAIAASSFGLGAIVTVAVQIYDEFKRATGEAEHFRSALDNLSNLTSQQLAIQEAAKRAEIDAVNAAIQATSTVDPLNKRGALLEQLRTLEDQLHAIVSARIDADKREQDEARRDEERKEQEHLRVLKQNADKATAIERTMTEEQQAAIDKVTLSEEDAAIQKVVREERQREQEIRDLQVSEDEKTKLLLLAQADRDAQIAAIHKAATAKQQREDERAQQEADRKRAEAIARVADEMGSALQASIRSNESYITAVTRMLLTPLEKYLEGVAEHQAIEAAVSAAALDFAGAARHAAVAALAIEGARKVAQIGGLNAGGGRSGAGSGGGFSDSAALAPRDPQANAATVVNLMTTNPYSRENIAIASYELTRAGKLNRPIYVPPTNGLASAGA